MSELVFLKLGGSLITDKTREQAPRQDVMGRMAREIARGLDRRPGLQLVLGHGSGSFGHFAGAKYHVREGYLDDWWGYAQTGAAAQRLNRMVTDALLQERVPVVSVQVSASARCRDGVLVEMALGPIRDLLAQGLVPLVYGDVALDSVRGCTIVSTEEIFGYLEPRLLPERIILAGEVEGVYAEIRGTEMGGGLASVIDERDYADIQRSLSSSRGTDVTGGMMSKVETMWALVARRPELTVRIVSGLRPGVVESVLVDPDVSEGTLLRYAGT